MKKFFLISLGITALSMPFAAGAQSGVTPVPVPASVNIPNLIADIINFLFGLLLVIAALFIIVAVYVAISGGGVEKARKYIIYAVVAIVVAFLSRAIIALVRQLLGIN